MIPRRLSALSIVALFTFACSSTASTPDVERGAARSHSGTGNTALIETIYVATPTSLELGVVHGSCDQLLPVVNETAEQIEIAVQNPTDGETGDCTDEGRVTVLDLELSAPLGQRQLVVEVPPALFSHTESTPTTCLYGPDQQWCHQLTIKNQDQERSVGAPDYPATGVEIRLNTDPTAIELSTGVAIQVATDRPYDRPYLLEHRLLQGRNLGFWGSVAVHNVSRPLDEAEQLDSTVAGFPAYWVSPPQAANEPADTVTIQVGQWFIDVSLWTEDPAQQRSTLQELLDSFQISQRPGQFPMVSDSNDWIGPTGELIVDSGTGQGFTFSVAPNCDSDEESCRPGIGVVSEGTSVVLQAAAVDLSPIPNDPNPFQLAMPVLELDVTDFDDTQEPLTCSGVPAFDPALLPEAVTRQDATSAVRIYTGISNWKWRTAPGTDTAYTGTRQEPEVVATYSYADGLWQVVSVTSCR